MATQASSRPHPTIQERENPYKWVLAVLGIVSVAFGLAAVIWPGPALNVVVYLFGAFAVASGVLSLAGMYLASRNGERWWPWLFIAVVDFAAAVAVFTYPALTAVVLVYFVALWAILAGMFEISLSLVTARFLWLIAGLLSLAVGFVLLANPLLGELALMLVLGTFAIVDGIILLVDAYRAPKVVELEVF